MYSLTTMSSLYKRLTLKTPEKRIEVPYESLGSFFHSRISKYTYPLKGPEEIEQLKTNHSLIYMEFFYKKDIIDEGISKDIR